MSELKVITKDSLRAQAREKKVMPNRNQMAHIVQPGISLGADTGANWSAMQAAKAVANESIIPGASIEKYGSAWDVPKVFTVDKKQVRMSTREALTAGVFASANTIPTDWQTLWDAMRIDISIRMAGRGTVRESFYNMINMPESDKTFKATEFFPYNVVFEENNGEGQAVNQGESRAGQTETIEHFIYAAGFTWTLLAEIFRNAIVPERITDAVTIGYDSKRDDLSMSPILNFSYSGAQQTAAATLSGANRQELLYLTMENAIDDLGERSDPITQRDVLADDLVILANPFDARHIARVSAGLPSTNERVYNSISEISSVVGFDGETVTGRVKDTVYAGVTKGTAYLVKKNRYMNIGIKRNLTLETDVTPDVTTLSREQRSWYFVDCSLPGFFCNSYDSKYKG